MDFFHKECCSGVVLKNGREKKQYSGIWGIRRRCVCFVYERNRIFIENYIVAFGVLNKK